MGFKLKGLRDKGLHAVEVTDRIVLVLYALLKDEKVVQTDVVQRAAPTASGAKDDAALEGPFLDDAEIIERPVYGTTPREREAMRSLGRTLLGSAKKRHFLLCTPT